MSTNDEIEPTSPGNLPTNSENPSKRWSILFSGTVLVALGFAFGAVVLLFNYVPFGEAESKFVRIPAFQIFFLAIVTQTVFWAVALGSLVPLIQSLWVYAKVHKAELITWTILFAALIYSSKFFAFSCYSGYNFGWHTRKLDILTYTGGAVATLAGIGSVLVNIGFRNLLSEVHESKLENDEVMQAKLVREYLYLRSSLLHCLSLLGIMLGLVTLAQSAKRNLIWALDAGCKYDFTFDKVLVFGLYYTVILVLVFLPTFSILISTGHKLRDAILPIPAPQSESWTSRCAKREKLERVLALSMTESLRAAIAVLAPLVGSLISLLQFVIK